MKKFCHPNHILWTNDFLVEESLSFCKDEECHRRDEGTIAAALKISPADSDLNCCSSSVFCVVGVCLRKVYIKVESTGPIWSVVAFATPRPRLQPHSSFFPGLGIAIKNCLSSQFDTLCFGWCGWEGTGWLCVNVLFISGPNHVFENNPQKI